jgi:hypothetical protein
MSMTPVKDIRQLHRLINEVYESAGDRGWSWPQLATASGLSYETVRRLGNYQTMYPRIQTVVMLAEAVGYEVAITHKHTKSSRRVG